MCVCFVVLKSACVFVFVLFFVVAVVDVVLLLFRLFVCLLFFMCLDLTVQTHIMSDRHSDSLG